MLARAPLSGTFNAQGYVHIAQFFDPLTLGRVERAILALYGMQAKKIGEHKRYIESVLRWDHPDKDRLVCILDRLEDEDKEALYQVQKFMPSSQECRALFDDAFLETVSEILAADQSKVLIDGPALFVNAPKSQRLLYKWHSEAHYYPKRRRFINVWLPIFGNKTVESGAMSFRIGSHKQQYPFSEYVGYNKDSENKKNHFVQYEIPENFVRDLPEHHCASERGDLILFHKDMVHRSNSNQSRDFSFAIVARAWTPEDDLTLSGSLAATPYGGDIGRAGLVVSP